MFRNHNNNNHHHHIRNRKKIQEPLLSLYDDDDVVVPTNVFPLQNGSFVTTTTTTSCSNGYNIRQQPNQRLDNYNNHTMTTTTTTENSSMRWRKRRRRKNSVVNPCIPNFILWLVYNSCLCIETCCKNTNSRFWYNNNNNNSFRIRNRKGNNMNIHNQKKKKKKMYLFLTIVLFVAIIVVMIVYFIVRYKARALMKRNLHPFPIQQWMNDTSLTIPTTLTTRTRTNSDKEHNNNNSNNNNHPDDDHKNNNNITPMMWTIFYNVYVDHDKFIMKLDYQIIQEQIHQIGTSYANNHYSYHKNQQGSSASSHPQQVLTIYYNTIGKQPFESNWFESLCMIQYNMNCIHMEHYKKADELMTIEKVHEFCINHNNNDKYKYHNDNDEYDNVDNDGSDQQQPFGSSSSNRNDHAVIYLHNKGSLHPMLPYQDRWRRTMTAAVTSELCLRSIRQTMMDKASSSSSSSQSKHHHQQHSNPSHSHSCNACGMLFQPLPAPHFPGNMWIATCSYIRQLLTPQELKVKQDIVDHWIHYEMYNHHNNQQQQPSSFYNNNDNKNGTTQEQQQQEQQKTFVSNNHDSKNHNNNDDDSMNWNTLSDTPIFPMEAHFVGTKRYMAEHWLGTHPGLEPCDVSTNSSKDYWFLYDRNFTNDFVYDMAPRNEYTDYDWNYYGYTNRKQNGNITITDPMKRLRDYYLFRGMLYKWYVFYGRDNNNNNNATNVTSSLSNSNHWVHDQFDNNSNSNNVITIVEFDRIITLPHNNSWVWNWYPEGDLWQVAIQMYGGVMGAMNKLAIVPILENDDKDESQNNNDDIQRMNQTSNNSHQKNQAWRDSYVSSFFRKRSQLRNRKTIGLGDPILLQQLKEYPQTYYFLDLPNHKDSFLVQNAVDGGNSLFKNNDKKRGTKIIRWVGDTVRNRFHKSKQFIGKITHYESSTVTKIMIPGATTITTAQTTINSHTTFVTANNLQDGIRKLDPDLYTRWIMMNNKQNKKNK